MSITQKLDAIKKQAQASLTNADDNHNKVSEYLKLANTIREENKRHNEKKVITLTVAFREIVKDINLRAEKSGTMTIKNKLDELEDAYYKYAQKKASLDRLGDETLFHDSITDMFVRVSWYTYKNDEGMKEERLRTDRFKLSVVKKFIDLDSKREIGIHIDSKKVNNILRNFRPYIKEFEPLKPKFYGDFFNTYTPNGFLDVKVDNEVNMEKFTNITMPMRYPHINALLENIAPFEDERVFMLNWLSTILNTSKKTRTAIILKGIQRTGKGVFASKIIEHAMNEANCYVATNANLSEHFNGYLEDKLFITFDEVKGDFGKDKDIGNQIKLIVSEERMSIRIMNKDSYMIQFHANCIFLSNEDLPIPMDQSDERLSVIETRSVTLAEVAKAKFDLQIHDFIHQIEEERDAFIMHLKMCKYNKRLASTTIKNKTKKAIQDATATTQSVLKTAFRGGDIETIEEMLIDAINDNQLDYLIKSEEEIMRNDNELGGDMHKVKKQTPFEHNNITMLEQFKQEFKYGQLSNTSLWWFTKALNIEHISKSDLKFGNFWNLILSTPTSIKLKYLDNQKLEKFRTIHQHTEISNFSFNGQIFMYTGKKTAQIVQDGETVF